MDDGKRSKIGFGTKAPPAGQPVNILAKKNIKIKKSSTSKD